MTVKKKAQKYIVRCDRAGVFYGEIKERKGDEVTMINVRKIWCWRGANAVEELAMNGSARIGECNITVTVPEMTVMQAIQIIPCTDKAVANLDSAKEWTYARH